MHVFMLSVVVFASSISSICLLHVFSSEVTMLKNCSHFFSVETFACCVRRFTKMFDGKLASPMME